MKTIIEFFYPPVMRLCLLIFVAMSALGGYNWISWSCLTPSDWAAWTGAIGTVGAIIGAIYIASFQERYRERENLAAARITAAAMLLRLTQTRAEIKVAANWFETFSNEGGEIRIFLHFKDVLSELPRWAPEEIIRLSPFRSNCAYKLAAAQDRLNTVVNSIQVAIQDPLFTSDEVIRKTCAGFVGQGLSEANHLLESALTEMRSQTIAFTDSFGST
jgi:hypothetical protein